MPRDSACEFVEPTSWALFDFEVGESGRVERDGLRKFSLETGDAAPLGTFSPNFGTFGDLLWFQFRNDRAQLVSLEFVDPADPDATPATYSATDGSDIIDIRGDAAGTKFAYIEEDAAGGSRVVMAELPTHRELGRFDFPGVQDLLLGSFASDGSGVTVVQNVEDRFAVYFLRVGATERENVVTLVSQGRAGRSLNAQPFPGASER